MLNEVMWLMKKDQVGEYTKDLLKELKLNLETGPWLAGGSVLNTYLGENVQNDLDIWFASEDQFINTLRVVITWIQAKSGLGAVTTAARVSEIMQEINRGATVMSPAGVGYKTTNNMTFYDSPNAITIKPQFDFPPIQLIRKRYYDSVDDVLNSFDITVCQFATDGKDIVAGKDAKEHADQKALHIVRFHQEAFKRFSKYYAKGYTPTKETIRGMHEHADRIVWEYESYESEYYNEVG